jgi:hypothetical protein
MKRRAARASKPDAAAAAAAVAAADDELDASFVVPHEADRLSIHTTRTKLSSMLAEGVAPEPETRPMDTITYHRINCTMRAAMEMSSRRKRGIFVHIRDDAIDHNHFIVAEGQFIGMICISNTLESQSRSRKQRAQTEHVAHRMEETHGTEPAQ